MTLHCTLLSKFAAADVIRSSITTKTLHIKFDKINCIILEIVSGKTTLSEGSVEQESSWLLFEVEDCLTVDCSDGEATYGSVSVRTTALGNEPGKHQRKFCGTLGDTNAGKLCTVLIERRPTCTWTSVHRAVVERKILKLYELRNQLMY